MAIETRCAGRGDDRCEFEIRPGEAWGEEADPWKHALEATEATLSRELEQKVARQARAISELSTPVVEVWDDVLVLPIVGAIDTQRSLDVMDNLLRRIVETQSRCVIIDITGVDMIDTNTADSLIKVIRAAVVLGTRCVLTGSNPTVARTLVEIGANMGEVRTLPDLKQGLKDCLRYLGSGTAGSAAAG